MLPIPNHAAAAVAKTVASTTVDVQGFKARDERSGRYMFHALGIGVDSLVPP